MWLFWGILARREVRKNTHVTALSTVDLDSGVSSDRLRGERHGGKGDLPGLFSFTLQSGCARINR